jgi:hypothetical protein
VLISGPRGWFAVSSPAIEPAGWGGDGAPIPKATTNGTKKQKVGANKQNGAGRQGYVDDMQSELPSKKERTNQMAWKIGTIERDTTIGLVLGLALLSTVVAVIGIKTTEQSTLSESAPVKTRTVEQSGADLHDAEQPNIAATLAPLAMDSTHAAGTAKGMMIASLYDRHCEKIPGLEAKIRTMLAVIPASVMRTGIDQAGDYFKSMVTKNFCEVTKPFVAAAVAELG